MRGSAEIIDADNDGVLMKDTISGAFMLTVKDKATGVKKLSLIDEAGLMVLHESFMLKEAQERFNLAQSMTCVQAAYFHKQHLPVDSAKLTVKPLTADDFEIVHEHYHGADGDYVRGRLESGAMFGGYSGGVLCGFAGEHEEGSAGLLEVFPEYRGKGYGIALSSHMVNHMLSKGMIPFGQVVVGNEASANLHLKLGFTVGKEELYWIFNRDS
jgi:GNAT superfamily N-acetyltransferase